MKPSFNNYVIYKVLKISVDRLILQKHEYLKKL